MTPLHTACKNSRDDSQKEIVFTLINNLVEQFDDKGEKIINSKAEGWSALHFTVYFKNLEIVKKLLEVGADVEDQVENDIFKDGMKNLNSEQIVYKKKMQAKLAAQKNNKKPKEDDDVKKFKNIEIILKEYHKNIHKNRMKKLFYSGGKIVINKLLPQ